MSSVESDWATPHRQGQPHGGTGPMAFLRKHDRRDDRPEGYYVDSGTYPVMPKSRPLSTEDLYRVLDAITPEVHAATMYQFSHVEPGE